MEMDSYRVGSLLELVREAAIGFATHGMTCRVCVQGSMGTGAFTGVPRVLSGVIKLLTLMDWQAQPGEPLEGLVGNRQDPSADEPKEGLVRFGAIGAQELEKDDDVLILLAPQSMVGASIYDSLSDMAAAAMAQGTKVVLINPLLQDRQSSSGVMSVRGRAERLAFAADFVEIYHFRLLYSGTTFMFPILGAVRMATTGSHATAPYVLYQRRESEGSERYELRAAFPDREPTSEEITLLVPRAVQPMDGDIHLAEGQAERPEETSGSTATDKFAAPSWD